MDITFRQNDCLNIIKRPIENHIIREKTLWWRTLVDLVTFVLDNFNYFFSLGLSLFIAAVCFLLYNRTANKGFISIIVGLAVSITWISIQLFLLGGVHLAENLNNSGMSHADISVVLMLLGGITLVVSAIGTLTLLIGLWIIANELPKKSYNSIQ